MKKLILSLVVLTVLSSCGGIINEILDLYDPSRIDGPQQLASPDWREETIYFVMIDRFANGNTANDSFLPGRLETGPTESKWNGGDLQGLIQKLSYIKALGFTAIWITPPVENQWWDASIPYGGYHGYWASSFTNVDPHFGTLEDYKAFVRAAHAMGMRVIQDIVVNHTGNYFMMSGPLGTLTVNTNGYPAWPRDPFLSNSIAYYLNNGTNGITDAVNGFHWNPDIVDWNSWEQLTNYQASSLDDINTENPAVLSNMKAWYNYWIAEAGIDGMRIDTVKNVPKEFWQDFIFSTDPASPGIKSFASNYLKNDFLLFGEVWTPGAADEDALAASYTKDGLGNRIMDSIVYYPMFSVINKVFSQKLRTSYVKELFDNQTNYHPDAARHLVTFIDNHDNPRYLSENDLTTTKLSLLFIYTSMGIPCVYYGTEQQFTETRATMFAGGYSGGMVSKDYFDTGSYMFRFIRDLNTLRRSYPVLQKGTQTVLHWDELGPGVFAYKRELGTNRMFILFNTDDSSKYIDGLDTGLGTQTMLYDVARGSTKTVTTAPDGRLYITMSPKSAVMLIETNQYQDIGSHGLSLSDL